MDYKKFQHLLREKEKPNIDFKIECHAFSSKAETPKAELAKDICAMANNGNVISYIIIGVSDDGNKFKSVENPKLTDENIQSFCKTAIYPPARVKVYRQNWGEQALPSHQSKEFVIIQIGPHAQKAFRLAKDFVAYKENLSYRRNDVWIRRGSTSDLATPEEIARMVNGKPFEASDSEAHLQEERKNFSQNSQSDKTWLIREITMIHLTGKGYNLISEKEQSEIHKKSDQFLQKRFSNSIYDEQNRFYPLFWKKTGTTLELIYSVGCYANFLKSDLQKFSRERGIFSRFSMNWEYVNLLFPQFTKRNIKRVRRIWLLSVLGTVPVNRVTRAVTTCRLSHLPLHFYMTFFSNWSVNKEQNFIDSSSELLIIDNIKSTVEFNTRLETLFENFDTVETIVKTE